MIGVNSAGMRNDGRATNAATVQNSVAEGVRQTLAATGPTSFDAKLISQGISCIEQSVKEGANLTRRLFNLIRSCKTIDIAKGTLMVAETQAIERANKHAQEEGLPPVRNLAQMAEANGMSTLSYVQIKSNIFKGYEKRDDHKKVVQRLYDYKERIEKAPKMEVQAGWCDPWSERYSDEKNGSTMFMKDVRYSIAAVKEVDRYAKQLQREAAARNEGARQQNERAGANDSATNGANVGVRTGQNGPDVIPETVQPVLARFQRQLQDACKVLDHTVVIEMLQEATARFGSAVLAKLAADKEAAPPAPTEGLQGAENAATDEVQPPDISDEALEDFNRPQWYSEEQWAGFTDEQRQDILDDPEADKDSAEYIAWAASQPLDPEEEKAIQEHGEALDDAANG